MEQKERNDLPHSWKLNTCFQQTQQGERWDQRRPAHCTGQSGLTQSSTVYVCICVMSILKHWKLNSGFHTCQARALPPRHNRCPQYTLFPRVLEIPLGVNWMLGHKASLNSYEAKGMGWWGESVLPTKSDSLSFTSTWRKERIPSWNLSSWPPDVWHGPTCWSSSMSPSQK